MSSEPVDRSTHMSKALQRSNTSSVLILHAFAVGGSAELWDMFGTIAGAKAEEATAAGD